MIETEVLIIGAGPAGIAAAIQLRRFDIETMLFEKDRSGGLVRSANLIENCLGFPQGITGTKFALLLAKHLKAQGISPVFTEVAEVRWNGNCFEVMTGKNIYTAPILIAAPGTKPLALPATVIHSGAEKYVFAEIIPLLQTAGKNIAIIGSGDAAFDYALNLAKNNIVTINIRGEKSKCLPLLAERSSACGNIRVRSEYQLLSAAEENRGLKLEWKHSNSIEVEKADYLLTAIGREPNLVTLKNLSPALRKDLQSRRRLFVIGDANNGLNRQAAIAAGDGINAAMTINRILKQPIQ